MQSCRGHILFWATPHNSKCQYGERGAADAKPKAQIILDAAKVSAASGGCSEPKQGQRSQSARGFCPRSTMRVPQPDIIEHFGNADAVPQLPERCLSRKAGIMRCCPEIKNIKTPLPQKQKPPKQKKRSAKANLFCRKVNRKIREIVVRKISAGYGRNRRRQPASRPQQQ